MKVKLISVFIFLLIVVLTFLFYVLATPPGTRWALSLASDYFGDELQIEGVKGRLLWRLRIESLQYHNDDIQISADNVVLRWQPWKLLQGNLVTKRISSKNIRIKLLDNQSTDSKESEETTSFQAQKFWPPFNIMLNNIEVEQFSLIDSDNNTILKFNDTTLNATINDQIVNLNAKTTAALPYRGSMIFTLTGNPEQYAYSAVIQTDIFTGTFLGEGNNKGLTIVTTQSNLGDGKLDINASLDWQQGLYWNIDSKIQAQDTSVIIKGSITDNWKLSWALNIPNITLLLPELKGQLKSQGVIHGPRNTPVISADLQSAQLTYSDIALKDLDSNFTINFDTALDSMIKLNTAIINVHGIEISQLIIKADGTLNSQVVNLNAKVEQQPLVLKLHGSWQKSQWTGEIKQFSMSTAQKDIWQNTHQSKLIISNEKLALSKQCLEFQQQRLCLSFDWPWGQLPKIDIEGKELDLVYVNQLIPTYLPKIANPKGIIDANLHYTGDKVHGSAQLRNGSFDLPAQNISFTGINIDITGQNTIINYTAKAMSGDNPLSITGQTDIKNWHSEFSIKGDHVLVYDTLQFKIFISPDLSIQIKDKLITTKGTVFIPEAIIKPHDFSKSLSLSYDVIYINADKDKQTSQAQWQTESLIELILGDNISLDVKGLTGKLGGKLTIQERPGQITTATGRLSVIDGSYTIYGKVLKIEQGSLNYVGGPVTNPALNISAIRKIGDAGFAENRAFGQILVVGVNVSGDLKKPKITLFSRPGGQSQADILSYLLLGTAAENAGEEKTQLLITAASALSGGKGGVSVVEQIQQGLGLAEIGLESSETTSEDTGETFQNTSLVLGKYLSPRLYVNYTVGLLEPSNKIRVRYRLGKRWVIQTEASTKGTGVDLLYTIER